MPEQWEIDAAKILAYTGNLDRELKNSIASATAGVLRINDTSINREVVEAMLNAARLCLIDEDYITIIKEKYVEVATELAEQQRGDRG